MNSWQQFIAMGGYATYVWTAYGVVILWLTSQWWLVWRRWQRHKRHASRPVDE